MLSLQIEIQVGYVILEWKKWISLEREYCLLEPFSSKTATDHADPPSVLPEPSADLINPAFRLDSENLEVGILIDAQDSYGTWYQVGHILK